MEVAVDRINVREQQHTTAPPQSQHYHHSSHFQAHQQFTQREEQEGAYATTSHITQITDGQQEQNSRASISLRHSGSDQRRNSNFLHSQQHSHHQVSTNTQHDTGSSAGGSCNGNNKLETTHHSPNLSSSGPNSPHSNTRNYGLAIRLTAGKQYQTHQNTPSSNNQNQQNTQKIAQNSRFKNPQTTIDESRVSLPVYRRNARKSLSNNSQTGSDSLPDNTSSSSYSSDNMKNEYLSGKVKHKTVNQEYPNLQYPTQHIHKRSQSSGIRRSSTANLRGSNKSRSSRAYSPSSGISPGEESEFPISSKNASMKQNVQKHVQNIQNVPNQTTRLTPTQKPPTTLRPSSTHRPSSQHSKKSSKSVEYWSVQYANDRTGVITTNQFTVDPRGSKNSNPTIKHRKSAAEKELCKRLVLALRELKDVASRAVILNDFDEDALDDEEYLILFIQELESCLKETITLESRQKQLVQQSRNGGGNMLNKEGYEQLLEGLRSEMSKRRQVLLKVIEDLVTTLRQRIGLHKSEYIHGKIEANQNSNNNNFQSERSWSRLTKDREPFKSEIEQSPKNRSPKSSLFSSNDVCVARYDHSSKSWKAELSRVAQAADKLFDLLDLTTTSSNTLNSAVSERTNSTVTPPQFEYDPESVCEKNGEFQNQDRFQQNQDQFHPNQNADHLNSMHSRHHSMHSQNIGQIIHSRQQSTASTQLSLGKAISRDQILNSSISSSITDSYRRMSQSSTATGVSTVHSHALPSHVPSYAQSYAHPPRSHVSSASLLAQIRFRRG